MTVLLRGFIFHPAIFLADERRCSTNRKRPTIVANAEYVVKVAFSFRLVRASARISVKEVIHEYETGCRPQRFYKTNRSDDRRLAGLGMLSEVEAATPDTGVNILGRSRDTHPKWGRWFRC